MSYVLQAHVFKTCALTSRPRLWPFICSVLLVRFRNVPRVCQSLNNTKSHFHTLDFSSQACRFQFSSVFPVDRSFILACSGMWGLFTSSAEREFHSSAWEKNGGWMIPWGEISICINKCECLSLRQEVLMTCLNWSSGPKSNLHLHWNSTHKKYIFFVPHGKKSMSTQSLFYNQACYVL